MIKCIKGFRGYYIDTEGIVYCNLPLYGRKNKSDNLRIVKPRPGKNGYCRVCMRSDDSHKRVDKYVHRLVGEAFLEKPNGMNVINHKDTNRKNNKVENLEWVDHKINNAYTMKLGHTLRDKKTGKFYNPSKQMG